MPLLFAEVGDKPICQDNDIFIHALPAVPFALCHYQLTLHTCALEVFYHALRLLNRNQRIGVAMNDECGGVSLVIP